MPKTPQKLSPYWTSPGGNARLYLGDAAQCLRRMPPNSVHCCVTSPPYWGLRDYGVDGQIGLESTPEAYVTKMVEVFREVRRVLRDDGTCWLNLGDSYAGDKSGGRNAVTTMYGPHGEAASALAVKSRLAVKSGLAVKNLVGIPWRVAFALQADGWYLRQDIIWAKPNPMPESVTDRCTKAHEYVFLLTKSARYFFDAKAIAEPCSPTSHGSPNVVPGYKNTALGQGDGNLGKWTAEQKAQGRNRRSVWPIATQPYSGAHFATMPPELAETCIKAGCPEQCCPACGAGYGRITDKERTATRPGTATKVTGDAMTDGNRDPQRHVTKTQTLGWQPACDCDSPGAIPGMVLDPFAGSGTTVIAAVGAGRHGVGIELSEEYLRGCAIPRIGGALMELEGPGGYLTPPDCMPVGIGRKASGG